MEYATAGPNNQVFVSRYLVALPSIEQLEAFLVNERRRLSDETSEIEHKDDGQQPQH